MFNLIVEKNCLRFYKYKFKGYENKPIIIEAYNKQEARTKLFNAMQSMPHIKNIPVVDESLYLPIYGETTKQINGIEHVWIGGIGVTKWIPLEEYLRNEK